MPVTKKKGAMFAIYADSPEPATASRATSAPRSPTKKTAAGSSTRRALSSLEPTAARRVSSTTTGISGADKPSSSSSSSLGKPLSLKPSSSDAKKPLSSKPLSNKPLSSTSSSGAKPTRTSAPKRQFEIFADPVPTSTSSTTTEKPRALAKRRADAHDKENAVAPDSPSQRTRSKVRDVAPVLKKKTTSLAPRRVLADQPLADVSIAYGADGDEPEGFRDGLGVSRRQHGLC